MKRFHSLAILFLLAVFAAPAAAQTTFWFQGTTAGAESGWGARVGPYRGMVGPGSPTVDVFCVDYLHYVTQSQWTVFESSLAGDLSNTYAASASFFPAGENIRERYMKAAWLATKFTPTNMTVPGSWAAIHGAMWNVMSNGTASYGGNSVGWTPASQAWLSMLNDPCPADGDCWRNVNLSQWTVITDVSGVNQEYLVRSVVPEPETLVLLGSGLLALGLIFYRRGTPV